jgi:CheY-like chemotaxis protein
MSAGGAVDLMMMQENRQLTLGTASAILLIDDNAIQAATRQAILRRAGYYVIAALNPVRALEQFQDDAFPAPICAVITDHIMPGMSGAEFVQELRKLQPSLPIMVISGLEEAEQEYSGLDVRFLLKPLSPDLLLSNLRFLIEQQRQADVA